MRTGSSRELLAQLRADRRVDRWVPALECDRAAAVEESRRMFSLAGLYEVVQDRQGRIAHALAVDAFIASGYDDSDALAWSLPEPTLASLTSDPDPFRITPPGPTYGQGCRPPPVAQV